MNARLKSRGAHGRAHFDAATRHAMTKGNPSPGLRPPSSRPMGRGQSKWLSGLSSAKIFLVAVFRYTTRGARERTAFAKAFEFDNAVL